MKKRSTTLLGLILALALLCTALPMAIAEEAEAPEETVEETQAVEETEAPEEAEEAEEVEYAPVELITEAEEVWLTRHDGRVVPGHALAYDQETGKKVWQFYTVPKQGEGWVPKGGGGGAHWRPGPRPF